MQNLNQSGHYTLHSFIVKSYDGLKKIDLSKVIHTFSFSESMENGYIFGEATIYELTDLIESFPLLGEEFIDITYSDFFNNSRTDSFFLYNIAQIKHPSTQNQSLMQYTIHFVSIGKFLSDRHRIKKTYRDQKIADYAENIYNEYYKDEKNQKSILIENTVDFNAFVIPALTPEESMYFLAKRAFTSTNDTTYRFFESRDFYFFGTNSELFNIAKNGIGYGNGLVDPKLADAVGLSKKTIPIFRKNYAYSNMPDRQSELMYEIMEISFDGFTNTFSDINNGGYYRDFHEIDLINSSVNKISYSPQEQLGHSQSFLNAEMSSRPYETFVIKDYRSEGQNGTSVRPYQHYFDLYVKKQIAFHHYNRSKYSIKIYGRNDIHAGSVIDIEVYKQVPGAGTTIDELRSGRFLVNDVKHIFFESLYTQELIISKELPNV